MVAGAAATGAEYEGADLVMEVQSASEECSWS